MTMRGKGLLLAANSTNSAVPAMNTSDSTRHSARFPAARPGAQRSCPGSKGLPYGLIAGAAFLRQNGSMINLAHREDFRVTPGSPWVSFAAAEKHKTGEGRKGGAVS